MRIVTGVKSYGSEYRRFKSRFLAALRFLLQRLVLKGLVWSLTRVTVSVHPDAKTMSTQFVAVSNHASHLDTPLVLGALPRRLSRYLAVGAAADYFFEVPWRRWVTSLVFNTFPVDRKGTGAHGGLSKGLLTHGVPLLLYPEGGRSPSGKMREFKPGAAALAIACGAPCLPVAVVGAYDAMPRGRNWPIRGRPPVKVSIGAPVYPEPGERAAALNQRLSQEVRRLHAEETH